MSNLTLIERNTLNGNTFTLEASRDVGASGTLNVHLDNPSDSGKRLYVEAIHITPEEPINIAFYSQVSGVSGGTSEPITNNLLGGRASNAVATQDVTYTGDMVFSQFALSGNDSMVDMIDDADVVLPPNQDIVIEATDLGGSGANTVAIQIVFVELNT